MPPQTVPLLLIFCAPLQIALAGYTWSLRSQTMGASLLAGYLLGTGLATLGYGLELLTPDLTWKLIWVGLRYVGNTGVSAPFFLLFCLWFTGQDAWLRPRRAWLVFVVPLITVVGFATNPWHHLHYTTASVDFSGPLPMLVKTTGPLYVMTIGYTVVSLVVGEGLMVWAMAALARPYLRLTLGIFVSMLLPLSLTLAYLAGWQLWPSLNLTTLGYIPSTFILFWAVVQHQLLEAAPVTPGRLFDRLATGVVVLDARDRVLAANPAALATLGRTDRQVIGYPLREACAHWPDLLHWLERANDSTAAAPAVGDIRHWNSERYFAPETTRLRVAGQVTGQTVLLIEVTQHRAAEAALRQQQRNLAALAEREQLARDLHDGVGQLAGFVAVQAQAARQYLTNGQRELAEAALARLQDAAHAANTDVRNFILGLRARPAGAEPEPDANFYTDLPQYVARLNEVHGLTVRVVVPPAAECPPVDAHTAIQLLRIVQEALNNVRKHAGPQAQATVTVMASPADLVLLVEDDGAGFDPTTTVAPGHLGLHTITERAEQIGARVGIQSRPGQGTRVKITLPLRLAPPPVSIPLSQLRVLLVDDQELFRVGLRNLLTARGVQVVGEANSGPDAIQLADQLQPDLVLMDLNMPQMDGLAATRILQQQHPDLKVVILTVNDQPDTLAAALRAGAAGYLLKDLRAQELFDGLEGLGRGHTPIAPNLAGRTLQAWVGTTEAEHLTHRQLEILQLAAQDLTYAQMAQRLNLSEATIKYHFRQIFDHLQVNSREQAVEAAARQGWLERRRATPRPPSA